MRNYFSKSSEVHLKINFVISDMVTYLLKFFLLNIHEATGLDKPKAWSGQASTSLIYYACLIVFYWPRLASRSKCREAWNMVAKSFGFLVMLIQVNIGCNYNFIYIFELYVSYVFCLGWKHIWKDLRYILQNCFTEKARFVCCCRIIWKLCYISSTIEVRCLILKLLK